jgi:predicted PurR-regulated permease PerM
MYPTNEHRLLEAAYQQIGGYFANIGSKVASIFHGAINLFAVLVMAIYLALHPGLYREWLIALFHPVHRDLVRDVIGDLGDTLRRWIVGQLLGMTILALLTAIGLQLLQVPYALTFGVFTGLVAIVPFFGTLVSTVLPALFVLEGPDGATRALLVVLLGTVIHLIESNVVHPLVMQRNVELPPVLTIMSVLIFGKLLGPAGLLVAVPSLAVLMVVVRRILINRIYEGHGFRRAARDRVLVLRVPAARGGVLVPSGPPPDVIALADAVA